MAIQVVATGAITLTDLNDARVLYSVLNASGAKVQVYDPNTTSYNPSWVGTPMVITPELTIAGDNTDIIGQNKSIKWYRDGTWIDPASLPAGYSIGAGTGKPLTINQNVMSSGINSLRITAEIVWTDTRINSDITVESEIVFAKTTTGLNGTGTNAVTALVSNESVTLQANNAGTVSSYTGIGTDVYVYDGATPLAYVASAPANGQFTIVATATGITAGAISAGTSPNRAIVAAHATPNMTTDTATISFAITAKTSTGTTINITKVQSFAKSKAGVDGTTPTSYWMTVSSAAIQKTAAGVTSPASLTITGFSQTGTGTPSSTASFKFVTDTSTSGGAFTNNVGSPTGAVASTTFTTNPANLTAVRFRMYRSVDTPTVSNFIDEQIIYVVTDGSNSVVASVWGPNGTSTRNGVANLTAQCDLYDGLTLVTSGATYLWHKLVGGSWTALTAAYTGYNTKTLTITPAQISGQSSFKCVATYNTKTYEDAITVMDFSDPLTISLIPAEGTVFRNSVGTKNVTCRVFKANVGEIDTDPVPANQIYEYRWFLNNADGSPYTDPSFVDAGKTYKTGKTIQVLETHVTGTANLSCELWTKS